MRIHNTAKTTTQARLDVPLDVIILFLRSIGAPIKPGTDLRLYQGYDNQAPLQVTWTVCEEENAGHLDIMDEGTIHLVAGTHCPDSVDV